MPVKIQWKERVQRLNIETDSIDKLRSQIQKQVLKNNEFQNFELYFLDSDDEKITVGDDDDLAVFKQSSKPKAKMFLDLDDKMLSEMNDESFVQMKCSTQQIEQKQQQTETKSQVSQDLQTDFIKNEDLAQQTENLTKECSSQQTEIISKEHMTQQTEKVNQGDLALQTEILLQDDSQQTEIIGKDEIAQQTEIVGQDEIAQQTEKIERKSFDSQTEQISLIDQQFQTEQVEQKNLVQQTEKAQMASQGQQTDKNFSKNLNMQTEAQNTKSQSSFTIQTFEPFYFPAQKDESQFIKIKEPVQEKDNLNQSTFSRQTLLEEIHQLIPEIVQKIKESEPKSQKVIHQGVSCDGCGVAPILGVRYKCLYLQDFDYCEACEAKNTHQYPFIKIKTPESYNTCLHYLRQELPKCKGEDQNELSNYFDLEQKRRANKKKVRETVKELFSIDIQNMKTLKQISRTFDPEIILKYLLEYPDFLKKL